MSERALPPAAPALEVRLLDRIDIRLDIHHGEALKFPYAKVLGLLVYLLLESGRPSRATLTDLLWPSQDPETARTNLRNAVHALRKAIGHERVGSDRNHVWFVAAPGDRLDTDELERAYETGPLPSTEARLLDLIGGYAGELLNGFFLPDAPAYMEWLDIRRLRCHRRVLALSEQLFQRLPGDAELPRRIALTQAQTRVDPWNESYHLRLIRLLVEDGRTAMALAHFEHVRELFRRELDTAPSAHLFDEIGRVSGPENTIPKPLNTAMTADQAEKIRPIGLLYVEIRCLPPWTPDKLAALRHGRALVGDEARRQGAHVCVTPDGSVLAYFGYPSGLPHAAQRALRTAVNLRGRADLADMQLRLALHHGVMLTSPDSACPDVVGELSDVVVKLAFCARSGDLLASQAFTRRIGSLELAPLERRPEFYLHGEVEAYRVLDVPAGPPRRETPLVGRDRQCAELRKLWRGARRGHMRAAMVGGPPGCGKSRLLRWVLDTLPDPNRAVLLECRQDQSETPFAPIAEAVRRRCGILPNDDTETRRVKFERMLARRYPSLTGERRQMIGWLAGLPSVPDELAPTARRRLLHDALFAMLTHLADDEPVLLLVEDLHWADPSTLALLDEILAKAANLSCLLLATARPPLADAWQPALPRVTPDPLTPEQSRALVLALSAQAPPEHRLARIVEHARGIPLYVEALTLAHPVEDAGERPASLEESLLEPIAHDELPLRVAQGAAALGEEFDLDLLRALFAEENDDRFHAALRTLERHGLVHRPESGKGRFHHALIRDALYGSLAAGERRQHHRRILETAPDRFADLVERQPHWLAGHAAHAGELDRAAELYELAAAQALAMAAHTEAVAHYRAARELLERLPTSATNDRRIYRLALGEGGATVALSGYGAQATRAVYRQILERGGATQDEAFLAHYGLWLGGSSHGGYRQALRYVDKLRHIAEQTQNPIHRMQTAYAYGNTHLWLGELTDARRHLEDAIRIYDDQRPAGLLAQFSEDTAVTSHSLLSWAAWLQGDAARADAAQAGAIDRARALRHPYSICFALACAARLEVLMGERKRARSHVEEFLALAERHDFAIWRATGSIILGWTRCADGDPGGIPLAEQGMALVSLALPALEVTFLSMFADGLYRLGHYPACAELLDTTLARCAHWDDHYVEAELLRLRALCADAAGEKRQAADHRRATRDLAERQGARALLDRLA